MVFCFLKYSEKIPLEKIKKKKDMLLGAFISFHTSSFFLYIYNYHAHEGILIFITWKNMDMLNIYVGAPCNVIQ